jgi:hypothetical protein
MNLAIINIASPREWRRPHYGFTTVYLKYKEDEDILGNDYIKINKGKFKNIYHYITNDQSLIDSFDCFWFPDPDLEFVNIDGMMDFIKANDLDLCQPALSQDSTASHSFLKTQNKGIRKVSFVEGQCPIFSRKALQKNIWTFDLNWSSFGIDLLWGKNNDCFVLDDFIVKHPAGPRYPEKIKGLGFPDPFEELADIKARFGV